MKKLAEFILDTICLLVAGLGIIIFYFLAFLMIVIVIQFLVDVALKF